jgi:hypothetical protein
MIFGDGLGWTRVLLLAVGAAALPAGAQTVRLYAGDRAEIAATAAAAPTVLRLGQPWTAPVPALELAPAALGQPLNRICCTTPNCASERNVVVGAPRSEVIGRYGASWLPTSSAARLAYPGIQFDFDGNQRVQRICVVPR